MQRTRSKTEAAIARGLIIAAIAIVVALQVGMARSNALSTMGQVLWSYSNGTDSSNAETTVPSVGDVDGDGNKEIIVTQYGGVMCFSQIGTLKWFCSITFPSSPLLSQADGDSALEIFVCARDFLCCVDGNNGAITWQTTLQGSRPKTCAVTDVDGNGFADIIVTTYTNRIHCVSGNNGSTRWSSPASMSMGTALIGDANGDGVAEIFAGSSNGTLECLNARNGSLIWISLLGNTTIEPLAACDVDNDGSLDLIVKTNTLACVFGTNGSMRWQVQIPSFQDGYVVSGDINHDNQLEVVLSPAKSSTGYIYCFSAKTGIQLWKTGTTYGYIVPQLADINNDHLWDICFSFSYGIKCLTGTSGWEFWTYAPAGNLRYWRGMVINDVNADGTLEMVYVFYEDWGRTKNIFVECAQLIGMSWAQPAPWPCVAGSVLRTNAYLDGDHDGIPTSLEESLGMNPALNDTDGDGFDDAGEIANFTNPVDPNDPNNYNRPRLINGTVTPASGDPFINFTFSVEYVDADDNAPVNVAVHINTTTYTMSKLNATDMNYTDGCVYVLSTRLPAGFFSYSFSATDGIFSVITQVVQGLAVINSPPSLTSCSVSPPNGTISTTFTFQVTYTDVDNNAPSYINLYIDGLILTMSRLLPSDTNYSDGCIFTRNYRLDYCISPHSYQIATSDGAVEVRTPTQPGPVIINTAPTLSSYSVSPIEGTTQTVFIFQVTYTDADSNTPTYVQLYIDGIAFTMVKQTPSDTIYADGCVYTCNRQLAVGSHSYYFTASDGIAPTTTLVFSGPMVGNIAPSLACGSVTPANGTSQTTFTFQVTYTDVDNNTPSYVNVSIDGTLFTMGKQNPSDTTYIDGCIYACSKILAVGSHSYYFTASDGMASTATLVYSGPSVINTAPGLTGGSVSPASGNNHTTFTFQVTYTDVDNDAPSYVNVSIDGTIFMMGKQNPSDTTYTDGCAYAYSTRLIMGSHAYSFTASDGMASTTTLVYSGPTVGNTAPSLACGSVTPANGTNQTTFTFQVTYTDADNDTPSYVNVRIDGTLFTMGKQNPADTTYTDGCVYAYSTRLPIGSHSYYFAASDGVISTITSAYPGPIVPNSVPRLTGGSVSSVNGTVETIFTFQ
nr:PQQ-binding-like beta-propeller repeat protein [Candidatus Sigynarchaeota archaeon]